MSLDLDEIRRKLGAGESVEVPRTAGPFEMLLWLYEYRRRQRQKREGPC